METQTLIMTDEQLIEEYAREIFGVHYTPCLPQYNITVEKLIEHSRKLREINKELTEIRKKAYEEGFDSGMRMAERNKIDIETLQSMNIKQLANWIESFD